MSVHHSMTFEDWLALNQLYADYASAVDSGTVDEVRAHPEVRAVFLASSHQLSQEVFGAASMVVECEDAEQMLAVLAQLEGQLTATLHASGSEDLAIAQALLPALEEMVALHRRGQACPACSSTSGGR